jgi:catechol 2,3-dioxygenase-like lactoylglutathione lyase family enzyme
MPTPTIDELTLAEEPDRWAALGFAVTDDCSQMAGVRVRFAGAAAGRGIVGWSLRDIASTDLDGLPTSASQRPALAPALAQPNGVVGIDHIVAVSPDLDRSVRALQAAGLDLRRVREEPTPAGAPRQAFFRLGREILELVQEPQEVIERSGGTDRPARLWGLALLVDDIDRTVELLAPHAPSPRAAVQPGRRITTVARSAGLGIALALMSRDERGGDERAGDERSGGERTGGERTGQERTGEDPVTAAGPA